jgi:hypothetical protein
MEYEVKKGKKVGGSLRGTEGGGMSLKLGKGEAVCGDKWHKWDLPF